MQSVIIGTAQWGLDYGVTNSDGRLTDHVVGALVAGVGAVGVDRLDTAPGYGDSEARIGALASGFRVQTKVSGSGGDRAAILRSVEESRRRIRAESLDGALVHDWPSLPETEQSVVAAALVSARDAGLVRRVGVSAYEDRDLESARRQFEGMDFVQVPVNVLDQRLDGAGVMSELRRDGVRVQARSVFLQGVALSETAAGPFGGHPSVAHLREVRRERAYSALAMCLGYVRSRSWVDEVVLAPTSVDEFGQIWEAWCGHVPEVDWADLAAADVDLVDPRRWEGAGRAG